MKKVFKGDQGFTLVELIVVIAILGILGGVGTVGYSGYIKKANMAADQQALSHLNTAFITACIENGLDSKNVTAGDITVDSDTKKVVDGAVVVSNPSEKADAIEEAFNKYFEDSTFKVMEKLEYREGAFAYKPLATVTYRGVTLKVSQEDVDRLKNSNLGGLGAEKLLTETADVINWANEYELVERFAGEEFVAAYYSYLGLDINDYDETEESIEKMQDDFVAAIQRLGGNEGAIAANAVALYAAQNTEAITLDGISAWLNSDKTTENIQQGASGNTLGEAAAIYGLYLSYKDGNLNDQGTVSVMSAALSDGDFAEWVKGEEGQLELEAYKSAMNIIADATDGDGVDSVLQYGFGDEQLITEVDKLLK